MLSMIHGMCRTQAITLAVGKQLFQQAQLAAPDPVGIEHHLGGEFRAVVIIEQALQQASALGIGDEYRVLVAATHLALQSVEQPADRAAHAGVKTRILAQQPRRRVEPDLGRPETK
jgi:hypothetical protein